MTHITIPRATLEAAIEALNLAERTSYSEINQDKFIASRDALKAALDAPEVEPVATMHESHDAIWYSKGHDSHEYGSDVLVTPLYTAPQERKPLSDEEILSCVEKVWGFAYFDEVRLFTRAIEAQTIAERNAAVVSMYDRPARPTDEALLRQALYVLESVEALIEHQYTGTRDGMNALQNAADDAHDALKTGQQWLKECGE